MFYEYNIPGVVNIPGLSETSYDKIVSESSSDPGGNEETMVIGINGGGPCFFWHFLLTDLQEKAAVNRLRFVHCL